MGMLIYDDTHINLACAGSRPFVQAGVGVATGPLHAPACLIKLVFKAWWRPLQTQASQVLALNYLPIRFQLQLLTKNDVNVRSLLQCTLNFTSRRWKDAAIEWDMRTRQTSSSELYFGSSPCQDFSAAGSNQGPQAFWNIATTDRSLFFVHMSWRSRALFRNRRQQWVTVVHSM